MVVSFVYLWVFTCILWATLSISVCFFSVYFVIHTSVCVYIPLKCSLAHGIRLSHSVGCSCDQRGMWQELYLALYSSSPQLCALHNCSNEPISDSLFAEIRGETWCKLTHATMFFCIVFAIVFHSRVYLWILYVAFVVNSANKCGMYYIWRDVIMLWSEWLCTKKN